MKRFMPRRSLWALTFLLIHTFSNLVILTVCFIKSIDALLESGNDFFNYLCKKICASPMSPIMSIARERLKKRVLTTVRTRYALVFKLTDFPYQVVPEDPSPLPGSYRA